MSRLLVLACAAALGLAAAPSGLAKGAPPQIDRGIVQSVSATAVVLKELDGSTVTIAVDASTRVRVNGRAASLADVQPGGVAAAEHAGNGPARVLRVFDSSQRLRPVVDRGVIRSISASSVVLARKDGSTVAISVGPSTLVRLNGRPATLGELRPGFAAAAVHAGTLPARQLRAVGRRRKG